MGEVYRARDTRLRREVALKVLRPRAAAPEQLEALTKEARVTGALNHPNILAVFDVGLAGEVPYVVSELLEGESLRDRLDRGAIPCRKALEYAVQIAQGLAAAHAKGIYHRDVKPANVFITLDGRVKLLDFGLAKQDEREADPRSDDSTASGSAGLQVGSAGYMAPEQVLGERVDERSDIFAFGALLYEMLTGVGAFRRPTRVEAMSAVLKEDPIDPLEIKPDLPSAVVAVVRRCLEKNREERFQAARDLAFHLQQLEQSASARPVPRQRSRRRLATAALVVGVIGGAVAVAGLWQARANAVSFRQLTFDRARIGGARLTPQGVVYSQDLPGRPLDVRFSQSEGPEALSLGYAADVLAERAGKLGLSVDRRFAGGDRFVGTLAEVPLGGGTPRPLLEDVEDADWDLTGTRLAVARSRGQGAPSELEYPLGNRIYASPGSIHFPRVARDGRRVAFLEDRAGAGTGGRIVVVGEDGQSRILTRDWASARGVAWSPEGDEVWYAAGAEHDNRAVRAVKMSGRERVVLEAPGMLTIWDAAPDGRVLITRDDTRKSIMGVPPGASSEQDLSWFDAAGLGRLSQDGKILLFGDRFGVYLRRTDGSPPVKLGLEGAWADDLSPDGRLVLATSSSGDRLILVPTGPGDPRPLPSDGIRSFSGARWFPDSRRVLANGREEDKDIRSYVIDVDGGPPRPITDEGTWALSVSPDGSLVAAIGSGGISLWTTGGSLQGMVPGSEPHDRPVSWTADGRALWIFRRGEIPARIYRLEIASGARRLWRTISPPDLAGVYSIIDFEITPDGSTYFYSYRRVLSELYVVRGLR